MKTKQPLYKIKDSNLKGYKYAYTLLGDLKKACKDLGNYQTFSFHFKTFQDLEKSILFDIKHLVYYNNYKD